jgi:hypothetical protein
MGRAVRDLTGLTVGKLKVLRRAETPRYWVCTCACSVPEKEVAVRADHLTKKNPTASCGCAKESHGHTKGGRRSPTYTSWADMIQRCSDSKSEHFKKGIRVCERWKEFSAFLSDMGERPASDMTIERKDVFDHYTPANCIWADKTQQATNRSNTIFWDYDGFPGTLPEWARAITRTVGNNQKTGRAWRAVDLRALLKLLTLEQIISAVHPQRRTPEQLAWASRTPEAVERDRELDKHACEDLGINEESDDRSDAPKPLGTDYDPFHGLVIDS